jgi:hypothetical protein
VKITRYNAGNGGTAAFEERYPMEPVQDEIRLEKVRAADGTEAAVVIFYHSGAGTTTDWQLIAARNGKFVVLDPKRMRDMVLKKRGYKFGGYNGVKVSGAIVSEELPGYFEGPSCCPDKPSIRMNVRFTGSAIKLDSVTEIPGTPR